MNSTLVQRKHNPQEDFNIIRLGNELYLYNISLFKTKPDKEDRLTSLIVEEIKSLSIGPKSEYYLYSSEGDYLLIIEYYYINTLLENQEYSSNSTIFWLFNINTKVWINLYKKDFAPQRLNNTCTILKYPYILLVGNLGLLEKNKFEYKSRVFILNTITKNTKVFDLKDYSGDLSFACQFLNIYDNTSSIIPSNIIELVVSVKDNNNKVEFYKIEKITVSEDSLTKSDFIDNLKGIQIPSYDYFFIDIDEIYFFDYNPSEIKNQSKWWEKTYSVFTKGQGRLIHYANVATYDSSIEVLNNNLYVISCKTKDTVTGVIRDSLDFYESSIQNKSFIRSCDYGYQIVNGNCQPCEVGTYNNNKVKGICVPCNTFLNTTLDIGSWSPSQCLNILKYASETDEIFINKILGVNETELTAEYDKISENKYNFAIIFYFILTITFLLIFPLQYILEKIDYFQINNIKLVKRKNKIKRLEKKLAFYNKEYQNQPAWVDHKRQNINEKIDIIKIKNEYGNNNINYPKLKSFCKLLVLITTTLIASTLFMGLYYNEEIVINEIIPIYESENLGSVIRISMGIFPVNQKLCDINFSLMSNYKEIQENPEYLKHIENSSYYSETENGGMCIIKMDMNLTYFKGKLNSQIEMISRRIYAKNLFVHVQSYSYQSKYPISIFQTLKSSERESFSDNITVELILNQKTFKEDYYFTSNIKHYSPVKNNSLLIYPTSILDDFLPLGSIIKFDFSIVWSETAEVKTIALLSGPDYKILILFIVITLILEGLRYSGFKIFYYFEKLKKGKINFDPLKESLVSK